MTSQIGDMCERDRRFALERALLLTEHLLGETPSCQFVLNRACEILQICGLPELEVDPMPRN